MKNYYVCVCVYVKRKSAFYVSGNPRYERMECTYYFHALLLFIIINELFLFLNCLELIFHHHATTYLAAIIMRARGA